MSDEVLATFTIRTDDGAGYQSGYITNLFRADGSETTDPREAVQCVGFIQEGVDAGKWINFSVDTEDEWIRVALN